MREGVDGVRTKRIREAVLCVAIPGERVFSKVYGEILRHLIRPEYAFHPGYAISSRYGRVARSRALSSWLEGHCRRSSFATAPRFDIISPGDPSCAR